MSAASGPVEEAVESGDLDRLTRLIDRLCGAGRWDDLVELRDRCRAALERGRQLWPAAAHAEYRLALEAPGRWAGPVVAEGTGRFSLGPLSEVAAARHRWADLAAHAGTGPAAGLAAHECVIRGEDLRTDRCATAAGAVLEVPLALQPWEPAYPVATYEPDRAGFPAPAPPALAGVELPPPGSPVEDVDALVALREVVAGWTADSSGRAEAVAVAGTGAAAVAALGPPAARMGRLEPAAALAWLAWAGASGGAHGRRRGMATGRFAAWWAVVALAGRLAEWPMPPDEVGDAASALRWFAWDAAEPVTGWSLHLAAEDPARGRAWALAATDAALSSH